MKAIDLDSPQLAGFFSYDLSATVELPPISQWLEPPSQQKLVKTGANPGLFDYKKLYPEFTYALPELQREKQALNEVKSKLDKIMERGEEQQFEKVVSCYRSYDLLRGKSGLLVRNYGAEIVSNAYLKMFEMMPILDPMLAEIERKAGLERNKEKRKWLTLHIAEAPGNFLLAINHYLRTKYPKIEWNWLASSYRDLYNRDSGYLVDNYGIMKQYASQWYFGADGTGDITVAGNLRAFRQELLRRNGGRLCDFMTSDVKYMPDHPNYNEEENYNIPVHLGHLLCALLCLRKGGTCMLKEFTFFESASVCMLMILAHTFRRLYVLKPETSKAANSEVYLFGVDYLDNLNEGQLAHLLNVLSYYHYLGRPSGAPALFLQADIPPEFYARVVEMQQELVKMQIPAIEKNLAVFQRYHHDAAAVCREFAAVREKHATDWIQKTGIQKLPSTARMIN